MTPVLSIGAVVGMTDEAALLAPTVAVGCSGGRPDQARAWAERLLGAGVGGLVSFGLAGGLEPSLAPGTLVIANAVVVGGETIAADVPWCQRLGRLLPQAHVGAMADSRQAVAGVAAKAALRAASRAIAVDMESGAVALACRAAGKPFAVLRAVADPAGRALPPAALVGLGPDGRTRPLAVAAALLRRPQDLRGLLRLKDDAQAALGALGRACRILGPTLGFQAD